MAAKKLGRKGRIIAVMVLTIVFFIAEITVGHVTGSIVLVAKSFHLLSDVVALAIGLAAVTVSKMDSSKSTFGWVRAEVLGALINAVFLLALSFTMLVDSLQRLIKTEPIENPDLLVIVGSVSLGINLLGMFVFWDRPINALRNLCKLFGAAKDRTRETSSSTSKELSRLLEPNSAVAAVVAQVPEETEMVAFRKHDDNEARRRESAVNDPGRDTFVSALQPLTGRISNNSDSDSEHDIRRQRRMKGNTICNTNGHRSSSKLNMRGVFLHVMGHALGSAVVVVSALLVWLVPDSKGEGLIDWKLYVDPALSLALAVVIVAAAVPLLKETAMIMLQAVPAQLHIHEVEDSLLKMDGVLDVHELHVWQLAGSRHVATLHLTVASLGDFIRLAKSVRNYFCESGVDFVTIQPEFHELHVKEQGRSCALECGPEKPCHEDTCCGRKSRPTKHRSGAAVS